MPRRSNEFKSEMQLWVNLIIHVSRYCLPFVFDEFHEDATLRKRPLLMFNNFCWSTSEGHIILIIHIIPPFVPNGITETLSVI